MTTLRLYTYPGFVEVERQPYLKEPYLARGAVKAGEASKPSAAPTYTRLALLTSDGPCTYEISPAGCENPRIADKDSPALDGQKVVAFGDGWTVSVWAPECDVKAEPVREDRMADNPLGLKEVRT